MECCARITDETSKLLVDVIRRELYAQERRDRRAFFDEDNDLHRTICQIAGCERVWEWLEMLSYDLQRYRWLRMCTEKLDWGSIMSQHYAICDNIVEHNADETRFLVSNHMHLLFKESSAVIGRFPDYFLYNRAEEGHSPPPPLPTPDWRHHRRLQLRTRQGGGLCGSHAGHGGRRLPGATNKQLLSRRKPSAQSRQAACLL